MCYSNQVFLPAAFQAAPGSWDNEHNYSRAYIACSFALEGKLAYTIHLLGEAVVIRKYAL